MRPTHLVRFGKTNSIQIWTIPTAQVSQLFKTFNRLFTARRGQPVNDLY